MAEIRHVPQNEPAFHLFLLRVAAVFVGAVSIMPFWPVPAPFWKVIGTLLIVVVFLTIAAQTASARLDRIWVVERLSALDEELSEAARRAGTRDMQASLWRIVASPMRGLALLLVPLRSGREQLICLSDEVVEQASPAERQFLMVNQLLAANGKQRRFVVSFFVCLLLGALSAALSQVSIGLAFAPVLALFVLGYLRSHLTGTVESRAALLCEDPSAAIRVMERRTEPFSQMRIHRLHRGVTERHIQRGLARTKPGA